MSFATRTVLREAEVDVVVCDWCTTEADMSIGYNLLSIFETDGNYRTVSIPAHWIFVSAKTDYDSDVSMNIIGRHTFCSVECMIKGFTHGNGTN